MSLNRTVLALDIDGTLLESFTDRPLPGVVEALRGVDSDVRIGLVTNQAGPTFRIGLGHTQYPTPTKLAHQLDTGLRACGLTPNRVAWFSLATWPGERWRGDPSAAMHAAADAATQITRALTERGWTQIQATPSPLWRKPEPFQLVAMATELLVPVYDVIYVGDRPEDREAAQRAGAQFTWAKDWQRGR